MQSFVAVIALVGCGGSNAAVDAAVRLDAEIDVPATLDCQAYCAELETNCTDANAQYPDPEHCAAACRSFTVGTSTVTDVSGNTLGCRIYHGGDPSAMAPETHCVHAGPGGDLITATAPAFCSGGDVCTTFCVLEIMACGSVDAPLPGDPRSSDNNHLYQYNNVSDCVRVCGLYLDKTHAYSTTAVGDSFACRLYQAIDAAIAVSPNATMRCAYTGELAKGPCAGIAMP